MRINISDLISNRYGEMPLDVTVDIKKIYRGGEVFNLVEPVWIKGLLFRMEGNIILKGTLKAIIQTECNKCLDNVIKDLSFDFNEIIINENEDDSADIMIDVNENSINLEDLIERLLILKLPMRVICMDDCKGLCPKCGINLNNSECDCDNEDIDLRLIKLKELLKQN